MSRYLYKSNFSDFLQTSVTSIFGIMGQESHGVLLTTSREAWESEIVIMKDVLSKLTSREGEIIFEYDIPRLGKRIDVVLLCNGIVFCLEFKVG